MGIFILAMKNILVFYYSFKIKICKWYNVQDRSLPEPLLTLSHIGISFKLPIVHFHFNTIDNFYSLFPKLSPVFLRKCVHQFWHVRQITNQQDAVIFCVD